ncbi:hypothetical protein J6590_086888 [Homalodisca vitripennis]|nr:hypothetical protein J6590_086888 [Homalodisca vitripennis]
MLHSSLSRVIAKKRKHTNRFTRFEYLGPSCHGRRTVSVMKQLSQRFTDKWTECRTTYSSSQVLTTNCFRYERVIAKIHRHMGRMPYNIQTFLSRATNCFRYERVIAKIHRHMGRMPYNIHYLKDAQTYGQNPVQHTVVHRVLVSWTFLYTYIGQNPVQHIVVHRVLVSWTFLSRATNCPRYQSYRKDTHTSDRIPDELPSLTTAIAKIHIHRTESRTTYSSSQGFSILDLPVTSDELPSLSTAIAKIHIHRTESRTTYSSSKDFSILDLPVTSDELPSLSTAIAKIHIHRTESRTTYSSSQGFSILDLPVTSDELPSLSTAIAKIHIHTDRIPYNI